jgi:predicted anti-sigma-YlaC factor YlaD
MIRAMILFLFATLTSCASFGPLVLGLAGPVLPILISNKEAVAVGPPPNADRFIEAGQYNVTYANAFVAGPAEYFPVERLADKQAAQAKALALYVRGREEVVQGLELRYPGFASAWAEINSSNWAGFLAGFKKSDVAALYWCVAGQLSAYAIRPMDVEFSVRLPKTIDLLNRAYELDPDFQSSTLEELLVTVYTSLPVGMGGDLELAKLHYDLAQKKTGGQSTGAMLAWASGVALPAQNKDEFVALMNQVLKVRAEENPDSNLAILLNQKKARWLLAHLEDLFI